MRGWREATPTAAASGPARTVYLSLLLHQAGLAERSATPSGCLTLGVTALTWKLKAERLLPRHCGLVELTGSAEKHLKSIQRQVSIYNSWAMCLLKTTRI